MLEQKDLQAIGQLIRDEIKGDSMRGVIREELEGEHFRGVIRGVIREEFQGEELRGVIREEIGSALEQIVLPKFGEIDGRFEQIDSRFEQIDQRFDQMDRRFDRIESTMVTKDFLEDRLADFKGTLKQTGGQALRQIKVLATELHRNNVLSKDQIIQVTTA